MENFNTMLAAAKADGKTYDMTYAGSAVRGKTVLDREQLVAEVVMAKGADGWVVVNCADGCAIGYGEDEAEAVEHARRTMYRCHNGLGRDCSPST